MGAGMIRAFQTKGPQIHPPSYNIWCMVSNMGNDRF